MNTRPTYPHPPPRLDRYVTQVRAWMMVHRHSSPSIALEQKMSRQGQ
ncbi:hypothetical protein VB780_13460 [Leptolyngbya sp. CCNP1308]|nr:hypothetical protein [Leptolyngbya sp. CCNP1308]MEA5449586.1 hypothetical protein [Leptolyngbya sp. CCNP1308]